MLAKTYFTFLIMFFQNIISRIDAVTWTFCSVSQTKHFFKLWAAQFYLISKFEHSNKFKTKHYFELKCLDRELFLSKPEQM